jgi:uncharacterized protein YciI
VFESVARPNRDAIERHVEYLRQLDDRGALLVCGPFRDGSGGIVCFVAETPAEADEIARRDPFVELGFKRYRLHEVERATRENGYLLNS